MLLIAMRPVAAATNNNGVFRRWARRLFLLLLILFPAYGLADLLVEAMQWSPAPTRLPPSWAQSESEITRTESGILQFSPELLWRLRPGARYELLQINRDGFHGPEIPTIKSDATRIAVLGDGASFGAGRAMNRDEAWPRLLDTRLRNWMLGRRRESVQSDPAAGEPPEIINFSVPCYSSAQALAFFRSRGRDWTPDICIVSLTGFEDAAPVEPGRSDAEEMIQSARVGERIYRFIDRFLLLRFTRDAVAANRLSRTASRASIEKHVAVPRATAAEFESNLAAIAAIEREWGGTAIFLQMPRPSKVYGKNLDLADYDNAREQAARKSGAAVYNLNAINPGPSGGGADPKSGTKEDLLLDASHPTPAGHQMIANEVARFLESGGSLVRKPRGR